MDNELNKKDSFRQASEMFLAAQKIIAFTGAGASTDSGIPDYRGIGVNYWNKYNYKDFIFAQFMQSEDSRKAYWRMEQEFYDLVRNALPNPIHYALLELGRLGKLEAVITQNVDGLHQKAGLPAEKIIELHGSIFSVSCLQCFKKYSRDEIYHRIKNGVSAPYCTFCHGILKTDTVLFGQPMLQEASTRALLATLQSGLFLVIGSSLLVQPAAYLVLKAKEAGAKIIILNLTSTPYDIYADLVIYGNAAESLKKIIPLTSP